MTGTKSFDVSLRRSPPLLQFRVWHLALLTLFVAIAMVFADNFTRFPPAAPHFG